MLLRVTRLATAAFLLLIPAAHAQDKPQRSFFLGGGPTGSEALGFDRSWGVAGGVELPIARVASVLGRFDYNAVATTVVGRSVVPLAALLDGSTAAGPQATLWSAMMGLRLHSPARPLQGYVDALVGLGHYRGEVSSVVQPAFIPTYPAQLGKATNLALSFGLGARLLPIGVGSLFADVHYDFYFAEGAPSPIVPVKLGLSLP